MGTKEYVLNRIRQLRSDNKFSLDDVAQGIGYVTAKGYYDLESGKTSIKLDHLVRLSKFYKVPIEFFFRKNSTNAVQECDSQQPTTLPRTG